MSVQFREANIGLKNPNKPEINKRENQRFRRGLNAVVSSAMPNE